MIDLDKIPKHGKEARERDKKYEDQGFKKLSEIILPEHREFKRFIQAMINVDPEKRPSAREALKHKFLSMDIPAEYEEHKRNYESKSTKHSLSMPNISIR